MKRDNALAGGSSQNAHKVFLWSFSPTATDCLHKIKELVHELEITLGPDTRDIEMRVGLHSGPVTAGKYFGKY